MCRANLDHWEYGIDTGQEVLAPTWEQLKALILELDEEKQTLVTYGDEEAGDYLAVGAGTDGKSATCPTTTRKRYLYLSMKLFRLTAVKKWNW